MTAMATVVPMGRPRRRWTGSEFDRLDELGLFKNQRVELIDGEILEMPPMNDPHAQTIRLATYALMTIFRSTNATISVQCPMRLGDSRPLPDLVVVSGTPREVIRHPETAYWSLRSAIRRWIPTGRIRPGFTPLTAFLSTGSSTCGAGALKFTATPLPPTMRIPATAKCVLYRSQTQSPRWPRPKYGSASRTCCRNLATSNFPSPQARTLRPPPQGAGRTLAWQLPAGSQPRQRGADGAYSPDHRAWPEQSLQWRVGAPGLQRRPCRRRATSSRGLARGALSASTRPGLPPQSWTRTRAGGSLTTPTRSLHCQPRRWCGGTGF